MALTLLEAAKQESGNVFQRRIIETFARAHEILSVMPFQNIQGNALRYNQEDTLPGIAFRAVNEAYPSNVGVLNPVTDPLVIGGGDLDVDKFIIDTMGGEQRATHEAMKIKSLAHEVAHKVIKGDSTSDPREFDGLQARLVGSQVSSNGGTSGGDPLELYNLDKFYDTVDDPTHWIMSKALRARFTQASRSTAAGNINFVQDQFGRTQMIYNGLPIIIADANSYKQASLGYNEAGTGGGNTATSIYLVSFQEGMLMGIQNQTIQARDLGELDTQPQFRTRVEWYVGMALQHPRAAARLRDISDAPITA